MNGILVSGLIRSGTTWVGRILATAENSIYIHEPFNPDSEWNACFPLPSHMMHITSEYGGIYEGPFSKILKLEPLFRGNWRNQVSESIYRYIDKETNGIKTQVIPIIKDPVALFSIEWLVNTHHLKPVIVLRHPIGIVKSQIRLGWIKGNKLVGIVRQRSLVETFYNQQDQSLLHENMANWSNIETADQMCLFVRFMYLSIIRYIKKYPEWLYICYEDISNNPEQLLDIMDRIGLKQSEETRQRIGSNKIASYDPDKAHQNVLEAIPYDKQKLFAADQYSDDWEGLYHKHFSDITQVVSRYVSWDN